MLFSPTALGRLPNGMTLAEMMSFPIIVRWLKDVSEKKIRAQRPGVSDIFYIAGS